VLPQPDGKLLAWGYFLTKAGFHLAPGHHFVARLDDEPSATSVELATARLVAKAGAGQATVTVRRLGDSSDPAAVNYATHDGSAVAGRDYVVTSGALSFAPIEVAKSFPVALLDPGVREQDREFTVTLATATGVEGISGPETRLVLVAPFGFRSVIGSPSAPRLTIFGSVGSTYLLELHTPPEHPSDPWFWSPASTAVRLTNEVQMIPDDPAWHDAWHNTQPARFYRLRRLAP
jgi:Calx-beta domain